MNWFFRYMLFGFLLLMNTSFQSTEPKIKGINISPPEREVNDDFIKNIKNLNANYVSINPVGLCKQSKPMLFYDKPTQWWGERMNGTDALIHYAQKNNLHVMLQPRIAISGFNSSADFNLKDDATWTKWENNYRKFILDYAALAEKNHVEIFCVGSDLDHVVLTRQQFWIHLINEIRAVYKGKLTFASSWKIYNQISFWNELDFIGVNAYFPLTEEKTPDVKTLVKAWQQPLHEMKTVSEKFKKQILFTEFGYRSIDKCAWNQNELPNDFIYEGNANMMAQATCYAALLTVTRNQNWFAGGFCYKWYAIENAGGKNNNDYTPQNKLAEDVLRKSPSLPAGSRTPQRGK